jgi:hypothetical protein
MRAGNAVQISLKGRIAGGEDEFREHCLNVTVRAMLSFLVKAFS